jgi:prophage regulatory protein
MVETKLLRLKQVEKVCGLKRSAIYMRIKTRSFPAPVRLGPKAVAWRSDDIQQWIDSCPKVDRIEGDW